MASSIPGPTPRFIIGNLLDVQDEVPIRALERLVDIYGPIYKLVLKGDDSIFVGGFDLFDELCDETRFFKIPPRVLTEDRPEGARGLFIANSEKDEDWAQAHRILMPAFGPMAIAGMFDEMHDIATQMVMKWARLGPNNKILVTDDFTRLTLDTIALCAMDYRFNSFYSEKLDPYVVAMNHTLAARSQRGQVGGMIKSLLPSYQKQLQRDNDYMKSVADQLVKYRRDNPTEKKDLLNAMIHGTDPKTGKSMRDDLIGVNMQTFLVAGHETTSGLLSFAFMNMLMNPETYFAAQQEVDRVVGKEKILPKHLNELKYINAVLRETLRLTPTAPAFARGIRPENKEERVLLGGKYEIPRDTGVLCLIGKIQRDPKVYGEDADGFKPERMLDENFEKLPKNAWKPFGTGLRACIGRAFAWQEALLVTALLLQNFDMSLDDPNYTMHIQQSLTIKPKDCYVRAKLRPGISAVSLQERLSGTSSAPIVKNEISKPASVKSSDSAAPMTIIYGSNTGTCQALAQRLASEAAQNGFKASVMDMDDAIERLPADGQPLVVITASYEGQPPDNAARFVAWLSGQKSEDAFTGVRYAVFGCGHIDWATTFQRIPTLVDDTLSEHGATRVTERGSSDVSKRDTFGDFSKWTTEKLWPALLSESAEQHKSTTPAKPVMPTLHMEVSTLQRASHLQQRVYWANVTDVKVLTAPGEPEKRHIEFQLPSNLTYQAGDYLAVLPLNPDESVRRVIRRFNLPWDAVVTISADNSPTTLPTNTPISVFELLRGYVEIAQPATRTDLDLLIENTLDTAEKSKLESLAAPEVFQSTVLDKRLSLLDLLERCPSCTLPFSAFLSLLPPLRPRHYSISSSPLADPAKCTLTYSVIDQPTWADTTKRFLGVAGSYLASLKAGDQALVSVRSTNKFFRLPPDPENTPIIMFCAGSGLAPFRGFVQERAVLVREGKRRLAPALLFIGCRSSRNDRLYAKEVDEWAKEGIVDVRYAFSREPDHELAAGCKKTPERMVKDREDVFKLFAAGAKVYVCGSGEFAKDLGTAARKMVMAKVREEGDETSEEELERWFSERRNERFVADVFS
ncbi:cytochrome P450 [Diplogelasinospora grovesii]|uniref:Bifunctional cytochrome P450/NADPH--P450 reductase n=1 Tax=Diplogelasinospora grovesii TaxID=303347 RepID=A0AAN6NEJ6_9PEZI|nr:cytochrome P450 [Diplogelasinospora grovesii]